MGGVVDPGGQRRMTQMIEHHLRRQAPQQVRMGHDIVALDIKLQMPAEFVDALGQRLDHVPADDGVGAAKGKANAADAGVM